MIITTINYWHVTGQILCRFLYQDVYSGICVLWTPWDQPKVSRLSRHILIFQVSLYDKAPFGTIARCPDYAGVHIFKCPD